MLGFTPLTSSPLSDEGTLSVLLNAPTIALTILGQEPYVFSGKSLGVANLSLNISSEVPVISTPVTLFLEPTPVIGIYTLPVKVFTGAVISVEAQATIALKANKVYFGVFTSNYNKARTALVLSESRVILITEAKRSA